MSHDVVPRQHKQVSTQFVPLHLNNPLNNNNKHLLETAKSSEYNDWCAKVIKFNRIVGTSVVVAHIKRNRTVVSQAGGETINNELLWPARSKWQNPWQMEPSLGFRKQTRCTATLCGICNRRMLSTWTQPIRPWQETPKCVYGHIIAPKNYTRYITTII